jgi:hypothetical protein
MTRALPLLLLPAVASAALAACRRGPDPSASVVADAAPEPSARPPLQDPPAVGPSRCAPAGEGLALESPADLELGDVVPFHEGLALGLVHRTAAGRVGAVAFLGKDAATERVVDLAPSPGDAPPPRLATRGGDLVVAEYVLSKKGASRDLAVQVATPDGTLRPLATIAQQRDDSFAFDLAPGLIAWDEAATGPDPRGVIRIAELGADHAGAPHDLSPAESDAELPRVAALPGIPRSFVVWVARRPETRRVVLDAAPADEVTGEVRTPSWLEAATVDAAGALVGPVRRLTAATGHVTAYDVQFLPGEACSSSRGTTGRRSTDRAGRCFAFASARTGWTRRSPSRETGSVAAGPCSSTVRCRGSRGSGPTRRSACSRSMDRGRPWDLRPRSRSSTTRCRWPRSGRAAGCSSGLQATRPRLSGRWRASADAGLPSRRAFD